MREVEFTLPIRGSGVEVTKLFLKSTYRKLLENYTLEVFNYNASKWTPLNVPKREPGDTFALGGRGQIESVQIEVADLADHLLLPEGVVRVKESYFQASADYCYDSPSQLAVKAEGVAQP